MDKFSFVGALSGLIGGLSGLIALAMEIFIMVKEKVSLNSDGIIVEWIYYNNKLLNYDIHLPVILTNFSKNPYSFSHFEIEFNKKVNTKDLPKIEQKEYSTSIILFEETKKYFGDKKSIKALPFSNIEFEISPKKIADNFDFNKATKYRFTIKNVRHKKFKTKWLKIEKLMEQIDKAKEINKNSKKVNYTISNTKNKKR